MFAPQAKQHVDRVFLIATLVWPDPHLALIVEIDAVKRDFGRQTG